MTTTLKRHARILLNIWPPFLGAGIRIRRLASDREIRDALQSQQKIERVFTVEVKDESGTVVAEVEKLLHFRMKDPA